MTFIDVIAGGSTFRGRLLEERSPGAAKRFADALPLECTVIQDQWSRDIMLLHDAPRLRPQDGDAPVAYQHPGLLVVDEASGLLAMCYGEGRLQDGFGPLRTIPVAEIGGDLAALELFGRSLQFDGAQPLRIQRSSDQTSSIVRLPVPNGRQVRLTLGTSTAIGVLLEERAPETTAALAKLLPLAGRASNTVSSGPLTRYWNPAGGPEGETPLEAPEAEEFTKIQSPSDRFYRQSILWPGFIYYNPKRPWRGLRMALRDATIMKGPVPGVAPALIPLIQLQDDWADVRAVAESIPVRGAAQFRLELV